MYCIPRRDRRLVFPTIVVYLPQSRAGVSYIARVFISNPLGTPIAGAVLAWRLETRVGAVLNMGLIAGVDVPANSTSMVPIQLPFTLDVPYRMVVQLGEISHAVGFFGSNINLIINTETTPANLDVSIGLVNNSGQVTPPYQIKVLVTIGSLLANITSTNAEVNQLTPLTYELILNSPTGINPGQTTYLDYSVVNNDIVTIDITQTLTFGYTGQWEVITGQSFFSLDP